MKFTTPLAKATLVRRYKRFLADVILESGEQVTVHTANTGSMAGCTEPGCTVWLSRSDNPKRKYALTWEIIEVQGGNAPVPVGINTMLSNKLVAEGIETGVINELQGYEQIKTEVKYGQENSRIDLLLVPRSKENDIRNCYVEVKNVTLVEDGCAYFPDAVSKRGTKHLRELIDVVQQGERAIIFFCVQRQDASVVMPADHIDPEYGDWLRRAVKAGVEAIAYEATVTPQAITLANKLPVSVEPVTVE
ncbi:MAG: DNA/RNA nuclease SfsA [Gammaproteobacteria bacterium]|jgi:sugar fermentation stimulation protein A